MKDDRILSAISSIVQRAEHPLIWITGFSGSGKDRFISVMLKHPVFSDYKVILLDDYGHIVDGKWVTKLDDVVDDMNAVIQSGGKIIIVGVSDNEAALVGRIKLDIIPVMLIPPYKVYIQIMQKKSEWGFKQRPPNTFSEGWLENSKMSEVEYDDMIKKKQQYFRSMFGALHTYNTDDLGAVKKGFHQH